jgi:hypothetical protein
MCWVTVSEMRSPDLALSSLGLVGHNDIRRLTQKPKPCKSRAKGHGRSPHVLRVVKNRSRIVRSAKVARRRARRCHSWYTTQPNTFTGDLKFGHFCAGKSFVRPAGATGKRNPQHYRGCAPPHSNHARPLQFGSFCFSCKLAFSALLASGPGHFLLKRRSIIRWRRA